jgi:hypothetical protein
MISGRFDLFPVVSVWIPVNSISSGTARNSFRPLEEFAQVSKSRRFTHQKFHFRNSEVFSQNMYEVQFAEPTRSADMKVAELLLTEAEFRIFRFHHLLFCFLFFALPGLRFETFIVRRDTRAQRASVRSTIPSRFRIVLASCRGCEIDFHRSSRAPSSLFCCRSKLGSR